ncbi:MAG: hypothetical protein HWN65_09485 [Candidatus Helarchaeota archaeon]|nr:hypothetical protein [Candidatus Helarchaeota archaeon]
MAINEIVIIDKVKDLAAKSLELLKGGKSDEADSTLLNMKLASIELFKLSAPALHADKLRDILSVIDECIEFTPKSAAPLVVQAYILYILGDIKIYKMNNFRVAWIKSIKATEYDPSDADAWLAHGICSQQVLPSPSSTGEEALNKAIELSKDEFIKSKAVKAYYRGRVAYTQGPSIDPA